MFRGTFALALLVPALAGCAHNKAVERPSAIVEPVVPDREWQRIAKPVDQALIAGLHERFGRARAAIPRRAARKAESEGKLVDPTAAETLPQLPPGPYHCRLIRLGGKAGFAAFDPDLCYVAVATDGLAFTKQTGSNLPQGYLYDDTDTRQVFLGTFRTAAEPGGAGYGDDAAKNIVGIVERVSAFRWRLILSRAGNGAAIDMYELVPVPPEVPGAKPAVPSDDLARLTLRR